MRHAFVLAAVTALAVARPELYKEKEDFQYTRSSSDDGTKAGFYGAQRGNMGGNYERAHNMDALAQHQMGGLVKTVQGELGDGAAQKSGSVFSAASSRGIYGSGHYDLSNLEGRNFHEGATFDGSQSQSYLASQNTGHRGQTYYSSANSASSGSHSQRAQAQNSRYSGYNAEDNTDQASYNNLQALENLQLTNHNDGQKTAENSAYYSHSGYHDQSAYGTSSAGAHSSNRYGSQVRLVNAGPARVYVRPGGTVAVPVAAQTYDGSQGYHQSSSLVDQNAINSETEVLNSNDQQTVYQPINNAKHYESSYRYRKEWEKHSTNPIVGVVPLAIPTFSPYTTNAEPYEETQTQGYEQEASGLETQNAHSSRRYNGYNANSASSSHQTSYDSEQQSAVSASAANYNAAGSSAYTHGAYNRGSSANYNSLAGNLNNQVEDIGSKPKSYQSSYSYHKSWERQGDPYIIKPSTNGQYYSVADGQASQRLTSSVSNQGYNGYGSNQYYRHGHHAHSTSAGEDCDENGHIRIARSYNLRDQPSQDIYEGQRTQNLEDFGQQSQKLEDLGQQSQNLEDLVQQSQNLEDFGQQSQKLEDLGQQSQNLEDFGQQSQKLEGLGQQSQKLEDFGQQSQKLEDLGQQSQNLEDFGQRSQKLEDFGQQSQNLEDFGQQSQKLEDLEQQSQNLEDFSKQSHDAGQLTQNHWGQEVGQQNQYDQQSQIDLGQQTLNTWSTLGPLHHGFPKDFGAQIMETNKPLLDKPLETESHTAQNSQPSSQTLDNSDIGKETQSTFTGQGIQASQNNFYLNQHTSNPFYTANLYNNYHPFLSDYFNGGYYSHQFDSGLGNIGHSESFYPMYNQNNPNYFQHSYYGSGSSNSYRNTYSRYPWTLENIDYNSDSRYTHNIPTNSSSPLSSLWDKIDNLEKETLSRGDSFGTNHDNKEIMQTSSVSETQGLNNGYTKFTTEDKILQTSTLLPSTTGQNGIAKATEKPDNLAPKEKERGDIEPEKQLKPEEDAGRGDIGPDDLSSDNNYNNLKPLEIIEKKPSPIISTPAKTPAEIETLSLSKETTPSRVHKLDDKNINVQNYHTHSNDLSVLSLTDQKNQEHKHEVHEGETNVIMTSTTPKTNYIPAPHNSEEIQSVQDTDKQFVHLGQERENFDQQNVNQYNNYGQFHGNTNHQIEDFGQQNVNWDQQNVDHQIVDFGQQSMHENQQDVDHQMVDFGQQNVNVGQKIEDHQIFDFGQQTMNEDQQSVDHQVVDFGQPNMKVDKQNEKHQIVDFGQQSMHEDQQDVDHPMVDFNQQNMDVGQKNEDHQIVDFGQQSMNEGQQSLDHQIVDFGQQNINVDKKNEEHQIVDFGQQNMNVDSQMVDFGQQNVNQQVDFGQQEQSQIDSLVEFSHQGKKDQSQNEQQLQNWGQQNENIEMMEDLNQHEQGGHFDKQVTQQVETFAPISVNVKDERDSQHSIQQPIVEPEIVTQKTKSLETPPEVTDKPGFWKRTKDKVVSWFSSS